MITTALLRIWNRRTFKVLFAFLDQGIFSTSNFVLNILLARWLPEKEYGGFAVSFTIYILITSIQGGLVLDPISVFGPAQDKNLPNYLSKQLFFQLQINLITSAFIFVISLFLSSPLREPMLGVAFATPFMLIIWLYRRACYIKMQTGLATLVSIVYSIALFFGLFVLSSRQILTPLTAFLLMGCASLIAATFLAPLLQIRMPLNNFFHSFFIRDALFSQNWRYGKWIVAAMLSESVTSLIYVPLIAIFLTLQEAAGFKTMQNLLLPIQQIQAAISLVLIPWLSKKFSLNESILDRKSLLRISSFYIFPTILYTFTIILFCKPIVNFIYQSDYYNQFVWIIPLLLISSLFTCIVLSIGIALRAAQQSKPIFTSKIGAAITTIAIGALLVIRFKMLGVLASIYLAGLVEVMILALAVRNMSAMVSRKAD